MKRHIVMILPNDSVGINFSNTIASGGDSTALNATGLPVGFKINTSMGNNNKASVVVYTNHVVFSEDQMNDNYTDALMMKITTSNVQQELSVVFKSKARKAVKNS
jgi:hypothetical protein